MHFVIAGRINCNQFTYAVMVAQRLKENLPDFTYLKIAKKPQEWNRWLSNFCTENDWYHDKSPLIWREIGLKNGKKDFIGDINKFLDLCYDYYGIPQDVLSAEHFNKGEMNWFTERTESEFFESVKLDAEKRRQYRSRQICITGAASPVAEVLVMELLQIDLQKRENGLEIRLFDQPRAMCRLMDQATDAKCCPGPSGFGNCRVATSMKDAFNNVDLVISLDNFPRKANESLVKWLKRNRNAMCVLGKALQQYAPPHCRVIIGGPSNQPICYNATVLASFATNLHVRNIVAVTQDLGREMLRTLSQKSNTPLKDLYCPPVWGFVGLNKLIDIPRTVKTHLYKIPGRRPKSTLPQGTEEHELRTCVCLSSEKLCTEVLSTITQHKAHTFSQLGKWPYLTKVTAILDLLKVWGLKQEDGNGEILSLGVYSDGTFNIPRGIYWSQPVILKQGFWVPFQDYPIPRPTNFNPFYLFLLSIAAIYRTKVKPRIYIPPRRVKQSKEKKKFDLDHMLQEVGMPAIRTDAECVDYLKYLALKELGIDLDRLGDLEEEEEEPEVVPTVEVIPEPIFCECWRQELKELQKIVFDRSSTTEVEVDLSENISGSEWSVINCPSAQESDKMPGQTESEKGVLEEFTTSGGALAGKGIYASASGSTVCSCGKLSTGSICRCLGSPTEQPSLVPEGEKSTEHFYKEQNVEIFEEDLKDAIYADTYTAEKHVSFDSEAKADDETGFQYKLYGRKDAARDLDAELKMKKRIARYERGGEESFEEEEGEDAEVLQALVSVKLHLDKKPSEVESLYFPAEGDEYMQYPGVGKESSSTLQASTSYAPVTSDAHGASDKSTENLEGLCLGEGQYSFPESSIKSFPEIIGEKTLLVSESRTSLEEDLELILSDDKFPEEIEVEKPEELVVHKEKKPKRKREGIPLCCLCRCLVPEGLPCCPCGATTVVEVFKKESVEIIIQSEDNIDYIVERHETELKRDRDEEEWELGDLESQKSEGEGEGEMDVSLQKRGLPPESFLPFSPVPVNKFMEAVRPYELTKEFLDSFKKVEVEIPEKCYELMEEAKEKLAEMQWNGAEEEGEEEGSKEGETEEEDKENLPPICEEKEQIQTDFSNLKLFIPCGLEDWRLTVQKKYREWFFQGPKIKDETYYDIAIEEVSEDEFEVDKELEQFFEN